MGERRFIGEVNVAFNSASHVLSLFEIPQTQNAVRQIVISHPLFSQSHSVYCNDDDNRPFATDASKFALFNAKVGGVADVIRDVPKALAAQGLTIDVVIPDYASIVIEEWLYH